MAIDYTRNELDIVIDLIRQDNENKRLTVGQVTFGPPNVFTPTEVIARDTVILATSVPGKGYKGPQTFYYNRVPLIDFVDQTIPDQLTFEIATETTLADLLPQINTRYSINLTIDKIVNKDIPPYDNTGFAEVVLTAVGTSLVYEDSITLEITQLKIPLSSVILYTALTGFAYDSGDNPFYTIAPETNGLGFDAEA